ncbi:MAG: trehalose-phosphatase, partial [SAR324 cluster bacterium]|nr:trehalose-phosphatase [SAR324 cluster bacterium]
EQALPYPGVADLLATLLEDGRTRVVLISGRAIEDLIPLLSVEPLPEIWGSHGWERRLPDGRYTFFPPPKQAKEGLERARNAVPGRWTPRCEAKPAGVAFHFRGMEPEAERSLATEISRLWRPLAERYELELHAFDGGLELRPRGRTKGDAVESLLEEMGAGAAVAYLGDDLTDEDGFRAIAKRGLGILVRPELRETAAAAWLRPPEELLDFLHRWARAC